MLESRSAYGYYGEHGGATGENPPKAHKRGWRFLTYVYETDSAMCPRIEIRACDEEHAMKQAKAWARRDGFTIIKRVR